MMDGGLSRAAVTDCMLQVLDRGAELGRRHPVLTAVLLSGGLVTAGRWLLTRWRHRGLPPGPWAWPLVGNALQIHGNGVDDYNRWAEQYGDVYTIYQGSQPIVILNSYDVIHEALVTKGDDFAERDQEIMTILMGWRDTITGLPYGKQWIENKKRLLQAVRTFGFGKLTLEGKLSTELDLLTRHLEEMRGEPADIKDVLQRSTANMISAILFNEQYDYSDPGLQEFLDVVVTWLEPFHQLGATHLVLPLWLSWLLQGRALAAIRDTSLHFRKYIMDKLDRHVTQLDRNNPRDFLDAMLVQIPPDDLDKVELADTTMNFIPDAIFSMTEVVTWVLSYVTHFPAHQRALQEEMDLQVGRHRQVALTDRARLPYTEAVLMETLRLVNVFTYTARRTSRETRMRGYTLPRGTTVRAHLWNCHRSARCWSRPDDFDPTRFLGNDGQLKKMEELPPFVPFGLGKRMCLGEAVAKVELFLLAANLLHKFRFEFPEGEAPPSLEAIQGFTRQPQLERICAIPR